MDERVKGALIAIMNISEHFTGEDIYETAAQIWMNFPDVYETYKHFKMDGLNITWSDIMDIRELGREITINQ